MTGASNRLTRLTSLNHSARNVRHFQTGRRLREAEKPAEPIKGIPYNKLTIGVPKEVWQNERRVALAPTSIALLKKKGFNIVMEENAGAAANFPNSVLEAAGASI